MARTIPKSINDRLNFFLVHSQEWAADPEAVGLTEAEAAALAEAYESARAAHAAAISARQAAESATLDQTDKIDALVELGSTLIAKIKAKAAADPSIYTAAQLTPPSAPTFTSVPPPAPSDLRCTPQAHGVVALSWTSDLKRTSFYRVRRTVRIGGRETTQLLAAVRDDSYIDETLPIGFTSVEYLLTPVHQRRGGRAIEGPSYATQYTPGRVPTRPARAGEGDTAIAMAA